MKKEFWRTMYCYFLWGSNYFFNMMSGLMQTLMILCFNLGCTKPTFMVEGSGLFPVLVPLLVSLGQLCPGNTGIPALVSFTARVCLCSWTSFPFSCRPVNADPCLFHSHRGLFGVGSSLPLPFLPYFPSQLSLFHFSPTPHFFPLRTREQISSFFKSRYCMQLQGNR